MILKECRKTIGSTWTLDLVWMIVNDCDFDTKSKESLQFRCPTLEYEVDFILRINFVIFIIYKK